MHVKANLVKKLRQKPGKYRKKGGTKRRKADSPLW